MKIRLDKFISNQLNIPRSMARTQIKRGKVSVDGEVIRDFAFSFDPELSKIRYKNEAVSYKEHLYLYINKPKGVISATEDKQKQTVIDLLPEAFRRQGMAPVGRLDRDTTGLLLITDDGDFAHNVISPKKQIVKTYIAELDGDITEEIIESFKNGITLADGKKCLPAVLSRVCENTAEIKIYEGKYHQVKRMFGVVGLGVNELKRISIGGFSLPENMELGECRELTDEEIALIFE
ncbi:MAG: pseudouridine synthase [Clostridia bacterium]|nr:pseudouridine synthase [Clostridia bacterium]